MPASDFPVIVVCDAGPLIHLDELGCLEILAECREVLVPNVVWQEVRRHRPSALRRRRVKLTRLDDIPEAEPALQSLMTSMSLDVGEENALRLMQCFPDAVLLTDDADARETAKILGYEVHGTIGMLIFAWKRGCRSRRQVLKMLQNLRERSTLHISQKIIDTIIAQMRTADE